jgi:hypothetical protein
MTESEDPRDSAASKVFLDALSEIDLAHMPDFERAFLQLLVAFALMVPKGGPVDTSLATAPAAQMQLALTGAYGDLSGLPEPEVNAEITAYRTAIVEGAHSFSADGAKGLQHLVVRLVPIGRGQMADNGGNPDELVQGLFTWMIMAVASGPATEDPAMWAWAGIRNSLALWSETFEKDRMTQPGSA